MYFGKTRKYVFASIRGRVQKKLKSWKNRFLNQAGKEVLKKSADLAMPTHMMACVRLPKGLCQDMSRDIAKFWWGHREDKRKIHWMKWEKLSTTKRDRGLSLRDLYDFNSTLLAKQLWRLITQPNLLGSRVLKGQYLKGELICKVEAKVGDSWV
ncbi:hypothetical protein ACH5RR_032165 [Cinchona calisaya]|uniref:Reverse transcriptase n=1 Tax=Cinchona calisaya TaxID=153742 RepID=A0ABD2YIE2_9GENT